MISYGILLALSLGLNARDKHMLALSSIVGLGIFMPIPDAYFYLICALVECCVASLTLYINTSASKVVARISMLLLLFHGLGWILNGYPQESPYHIMVKISEHAELLACIFLSRPITKMVTYV